LKNFDAAIADYTFILDKAPNDTEALTKRGYTYSLMGQYEKAIPDYQAALKLNPQDNDTFSRLQWTQGQLKAKNAPPPTTTTAAPAATPEKPSLMSQIKPLYIVIGVVVLILIAIIVRMLTRGKVEETSHIIR
jgi:tetratricopeptide (TPR) repeat protein